jgi:Carboxypeptidase regulatory-like domain/TonB dependent receptor-like, beta-barrel
MNHKLIAFLLLALTLAWTPAVWAQSDRGSMTGTVTDPSGAVVPNAKVTVTNLNTNEVRDTTTSDQGSFTVPQLKADPYKVTVEAPGFKSATVENVQVGVQVTRTVDVKLEIGVVTDVVTVSSDSAPVIQTDSPVRQTNVTERQVRELPLQVSVENAGRTPLSFIFLDSNVSSSGRIGEQQGGTSANRFRVSGGQALGTDILVDGASTRRAQSGTFFTEVAPGPNAFQEFTLSTSTYSAEFGNSSGGIVNFTIKSGTNDFHGEIYELHRNDALNANTYVNNANNTPKLIDRQHDFGFNIGGPVYLPRFGAGGPSLISLKDRTFWFFNYEGYRFTQTETAFITVPTLRMREGDFGELFTDPKVLQDFPGGVQIYNPRSGPPGTRTPFAGNIIPLSAQDPVGIKLMQVFPRPTRPGVFHNYLATSTKPTIMDNYVFKIDHALTESQRLSVSYSNRQSSTIGSIGALFPRYERPWTAWGTSDQIITAHIARVQHDWTFSPTLLNHLSLGYSRNETFNQSPGVTGNATDPFFLGIPQNSVIGGALPSIDFPGYNQLTDARGAQGFGGTWVNNSPFADNLTQASDFITWVKGRHSLRIGGDLRWQQFNPVELRAPGGWFNFRHLQTANADVNNQGWPLASLITGATEWSFNSNKTMDPGWRYFYNGFFVQDDIKVTPKLTLNVGVRYEISHPRTESHGRYRSFDPTVVNPVVGRLGALVSADPNAQVKSRFEGLVATDKSNIGPRVGFAYSINDKTVVRGGYGIYYAPILFGFAGDLSSSEGTEGYNTTIARPQFGADANFFLSTYPDRPANDPNNQFIGAEDISYINQNYKAGRTQQWSLDVQRQLPKNFAVSVGYIGNRGTRLRSDIGRVNALPLEALRLGILLLNKPLADVTAADRTYASSVGFALPSSPGAVFPGFNGTVAQSLRPFPQYGRINNIQESEGQSWYNALQVKVGRRFSRGVQFDVSYTFSRLTGTAAEDLYGGTPINAPPNPYNRTRTVSPNALPHVLVFNYILELPFGKGKRFFNQGGIVNALLGGWQVGGIHRYQSGLPLVVVSSTNNAWLNTVGFSGFRGAVFRPNLTGSPITTGNDASGLNFQVLNRNAFSEPPNFEAAPSFPDPTPGDPNRRTPFPIGSPEYRAYYADPLRFFGNAPPVFEDIRPLPYYSENFSLLKRTRITETVVFEIRGEFFNIFNRHYYGMPDNNIGSGVFGSSNVLNEQPRTIQVGAKVIF